MAAAVRQKAAKQRIRIGIRSSWLNAEPTGGLSLLRVCPGAIDDAGSRTDGADTPAAGLRAMFSHAATRDLRTRAQPRSCRAPYVRANCPHRPPSPSRQRHSGQRQSQRYDLSRFKRLGPTTSVPPSTPTIGETSTVVAAIEAGTMRKARNHAR